MHLQIQANGLCGLCWACNSGGEVPIWFHWYSSSFPQCQLSEMPLHWVMSLWTWIEFMECGSVFVVLCILDCSFSVFSRSEAWMMV